MILQSQSKGYRTEEYIGVEALESVRFLWEQWQTHPNAEFDFFSTIVKNRQDVVSPVALVIYNKDNPVALAACRLEKVELPLSIGYIKVSRLKILQLTVVYGGLMGSWDETAAIVFIQYLRQLMREKHIDAVYLAAMRLDNPVYKAANLLVSFFLRDVALKNNLHWWADLPDTFIAFQKRISAKHRGRLRSNERKLLEYSNGTIQCIKFFKKEDVMTFCTAAEKIARSTYHRGIGVGFFNNEEMRSRLGLAASKGWMRGYVLKANENPCAFWLGSLHDHLFHLEYTGYDPSLKDFTVGQILFEKMVEDLYVVCDVKGIDFGFGDAIYKQRYGNRNWKESDLYLFNSTPVMLLTNLVRKATALLRLCAKITLQRFDLLTRIKKHCRMTAEKTVRKLRVNRLKGHES